MSCTALKRIFEQERNGLTFQRALEIYNETRGSVAAHKAELEELKARNTDPGRISHLQARIADGERLLQDIEDLRWH